MNAPCSFNKLPHPALLYFSLAVTVVSLSFSFFLQAWGEKIYDVIARSCGASRL